jgi:hypothetical protein
VDGAPDSAAILAAGKAATPAALNFLAAVTLPGFFLVEGTLFLPAGDFFSVESTLFFAVRVFFGG